MIHCIKVLFLCHVRRSLLRSASPVFVRAGKAPHPQAPSSFSKSEVSRGTSDLVYIHGSDYVFSETPKSSPPLVGDCFLVSVIPISNRPLRARLLPPLKGEVSPAQAPVTEGSPPVPRFIANQSDKRAVEGASPYDAAGRFPLSHCHASLRWQAFGLCRGAARIPIRRRRRHLNYSLFTLHSLHFSFLPRSLETPLAAAGEDAIIKGNSANSRAKRQETRRKP